MNKMAFVVITVMIGFLSACASTGPADDGFENSLESVDIGTIQTGEVIEHLRKGSKSE